jgi:DNA-binding HxlR family transcriptional regulator
VGSSDISEYCSFTKAIEHLGDRWTLLIVRELGIFGPHGFNRLAASLPGRIPRATLADRLHRLEDLGMASRERTGRRASYRLTDAGVALLPTILSLRSWADRWIPDDPAMAVRDPTVILAWMGDRVDPAALPGHSTVLDITVRMDPDYRGWLVLQAGAAPYGCAADPMLAESTYLYLEAGAPVMIGLARGHRDWRRSLEDGSLRANGDPDQLDQLPTWFRPPVASPMNTALPPGAIGPAASLLAREA